MAEVLIVDDDPADRMLLRMALHEIGVSVAEAADLASARAQYGAAAPRLVICDHRLPDGAGAEFIGSLAGPRILVSGSDVPAGDLPGDVEFRVKPLDVDEYAALAKHIQTLLEAIDA